MATEAVVNDGAWKMAPAAHRRGGWRRPLAAGVAIALVGLLAGDRGAQTANTVQGIDPLEILDLQVKPNVLFVLDTSVDMALTAEGAMTVGGDDPISRFYMAKQALRELIADNDGVANFGIIDLNADQSQLALNDVNRVRGPLIYVSADANAAAWHGPNSSTTSAGLSATTTATRSASGSRPCRSRTRARSRSSRASGPRAPMRPPYLGRHYLASRLFRHSVKYTWDPTGGGSFDRAAAAPSTPRSPARRRRPACSGDDVDEFNDGTEPRACFQLEDATTPGAPPRPTT